MIYHRQALYRLSPERWLTLDLRLMLFHQASTAAPEVADEYVADLVPAANELVNPDYARATVTPPTVAWDGANNRYRCIAPTVVWPAVAGASIGQGIKGATLYAHETDDTDSWLIASTTFATKLLTGGDITVAWDTTGALTVSTTSS